MVDMEQVNALRFTDEDMASLRAAHKAIVGPVEYRRGRIARLITLCEHRLEQLAEPAIDTPMLPLAMRRHWRYTIRKLALELQDARLRGINVAELVQGVRATREAFAARLRAECAVILSELSEVQS